MTTYPLSTLAPTISETGVYAHPYSDIYNSLVATYQKIYGSDIVLDNDSQDGQMLGVFAQAIYDCGQQVVNVYNSFSPSKAQGVALSSNVKINGLQRDVPSNSTIPVSCVGVAGTVITNGIVQDNTNGYQWALPASFVIPTSGAIVETATCTTEGAIVASAGAMQIVTQTKDWQSATATSAATVGAPVESDATLRQRQALSTSLPAQTILEAIVGAVRNVAGVKTVKPYQNDSGVTDSNGVPGHSIALVVDGGDAVAIATAIAKKKNPGTGTLGTTSEIIIDQNGVPTNVKFLVPTQKTILVELTIRAMTGYTAPTGVAIINALVAAINSAGIGANNGLLSLSYLYSVIYSVSNSNTFNVTLLKIAIDPNAPAAADLTIGFDQLPVCASGNITLAVT